MKTQVTNGKKGSPIINIIKRRLTRKILILIFIILILAVGIIGITKVIHSKNQTTKIGFENIGELATQSAYCTQINVSDSSRKLFGAKIPFTQSKYIYSYGVTVKAGFDFEEIEWEKNDATIIVKLPEPRILSSDIDLESFQVYHEKESIFNQITLEENNEVLTELKQKAEDEAVKNGLFDNARSNAEVILTGFFGNVYNLDEYKIIYEDK